MHLEGARAFLRKIHAYAALFNEVFEKSRRSFYPQLSSTNQFTYIHLLPPSQVLFQKCINYNLPQVEIHIIE